ncbi:MAG TPA: DUF1016 N-terminal domain-containing protein [Ginsengibacter sp.]|nr:DUF1016 N-terminal domain-containing protein [Ginsengibacter sp.]HRP16415.1 DUF1016 N-terminal domain-containing protein [Ginsengibacter sp.]HRP43222.1 DUF1016 N-terminal domain-containing protein [Ginsengibacter sp.]
MNKPASYNTLVKDIGELLKQARAKAAYSVNAILVNTYWHIGRHIVEFEHKASSKATYGTELLDNLSNDLTLAYGKGFSRSNLIYIRKFYLAFPKSETLSHQLRWSHYVEILKTENELEISFYTRQCEKEHWSVRELKCPMKKNSLTN